MKLTMLAPWTRRRERKTAGTLRSREFSSKEVEIGRVVVAVVVVAVVVVVVVRVR